MLREEILESYRAITQFTSILYAAVAAIFTYASKENNYILYLIPYIVIIPMFLAAQDKLRSICGIAAYLIVFHEGNHFNWEKRHGALDLQLNRNRKHNWDATFPSYYCIAIISSVAAGYNLLIADQYDCIGKIIRGAIIFFGTIVFLLIMRSHAVDYNDERSKMVENWSQIKSGEKNKIYKIIYNKPQMNHICQTKVVPFP